MFENYEHEIAANRLNFIFGVYQLTHAEDLLALRSLDSSDEYRPTIGYSPQFELFIAQLFG